MNAEPVSTSIIPAAPGWSILERIHEADGKISGFHRAAVIAWKVDLFSRRTGETYVITTPITPEVGGIDDDILERPDGVIVLVELCDFDTEAEAIDYLNEEHDR
jgi:hypothetical protein